MTTPFFEIHFRIVPVKSGYRHVAFCAHDLLQILQQVIAQWYRQTKMPKLKYLFLSLVIGMSFTLLLFALSEYGIAPRFAGAFLSPGLLVAMAANFGAHDLQTYYLIGGADACLYGAITFFLVKLLDGRSREGKIR